MVYSADWQPTLRQKYREALSYSSKFSEVSIVGSDLEKMSLESTSPSHKETDKETCEAKTSDTCKESQTDPEKPKPFFSLSSHKDHDGKKFFTAVGSVEETNPPNTAAAIVGEAKMPIPPSLLTPSLRLRQGMTTEEPMQGEGQTD